MQMETEQLERTGPVTLRGLRKSMIQYQRNPMFCKVTELLPAFRGQCSDTKNLETEAALRKSWAKPPGQKKNVEMEREN